MYVFMYGCMYACVHVYTRTLTHTHTHTVVWQLDSTLSLFTLFSLSSLTHSLLTLFSHSSLCLSLFSVSLSSFTLTYSKKLLPGQDLNNLFYYSFTLSVSLRRVERCVEIGYGWRFNRNGPMYQINQVSQSKRERERAEI